VCAAAAGASACLFDTPCAAQVRFVQTLEGYRPDVLVLDQNLMSTEWFKEKHLHHFPNVTFPGKLLWPSRTDGYNLQEFLDQNIQKFRIFVFPYFKEPSPHSSYALIPFGYGQEIVPCESKGKSSRKCEAPTSHSIKLWGESANQFLPKPTQLWQHPAYKYPNWMWEGFYRTYHADAVMRYAKFALDHRQTISGAAQKAVKWYEDLLGLDAAAARDPDFVEDHRLLSKAHVLQLRRNRGIACWFVVNEGDTARKSCVVEELTLYLKFLESEPSTANEADKQQMMSILQSMK
jgi:hypothetical protein